MSKSFNTKYNSYTIAQYGSRVNGLCNNSTSDLDLTFIIKDYEIDHSRILGDILTVLNKYGGGRYLFEKGMPRHDKSGWILRMRQKDENISIDVMVNKVSEIFNSKLIAKYCQIDEKFVKIVHYLKVWSKNSDKDHFRRLNNFSLYLMLIAFMQKLKILPNL